LGLLKAVEGLSRGEDHSILTIRERHHRQFDNLVAFGIESGRLDVDEQAGLGRAAVGGVDLCAGDELSQSYARFWVMGDQAAR
ncbi:MAG: hypothetical protein MUO39_13485, partial [Steroidobacteraceae bacterium]|nr:hypothetical protein [Steroidobacteraceae bacterium]